jgi:hypothetical protein
MPAILALHIAACVTICRAIDATPTLDQHQVQPWGQLAALAGSTPSGADQLVATHKVAIGHQTQLMQFVLADGHLQFRETQQFDLNHVMVKLESQSAVLTS